MIEPKELAKSMLEIARETEAFSALDLVWIESILKRSDSQNGIDQLRPLIIACDEYNHVKKDYSLFKQHMGHLDLNQKLYTAKSLYYVQPKILIATPQRKKHPKFTAPNLQGFIAPQTMRCEVEPVYNLGYCEARQYFVDKALKDGSFTHILFLDDDILMPLDAIQTLVSAKELIAGCNYVKRNPLLESVATYIGEDNINVAMTQQEDANPITVNATGLGATLVSVDVFRMLPHPHFQFIWETRPDGSRGRLLIGEDSKFIQNCLVAGIKPKVFPNLSCIHVDFASGNQYGPEWLVDSKTRKIRPEFKDKYCTLACDPKELLAPDNDNVFSDRQGR